MCMQKREQKGVQGVHPAGGETYLRQQSYPAAKDTEKERAVIQKLRETPGLYQQYERLDEHWKRRFMDYYTMSTRLENTSPSGQVLVLLGSTTPRQAETIIQGRKHSLLRTIRFSNVSFTRTSIQTGYPGS